MTTSFACVGCGRCCHGLRLPLSCREAYTWLGRGGGVEVFADAIPWPSEPSCEAALAAYRRERTFPARSGALPIRVSLTLMAAFDGPCPNLGADARCSIYTERPRACRIYPAEVNPFIPVQPEQKLCPTMAWTSGKAFPDTETQTAVQRMHDVTVEDTRRKARLAQRLSISAAGLANEGWVVHPCSPERLMLALTEVMDVPEGDLPPEVTPWQLVSEQEHTLAALEDCKANAEIPRASTTPWRYLAH